MESNMFTMWAGITKIQGELLPAVQMEHGKSLHNNWPESILYANKYVIFWSNWELGLCNFIYESNHSEWI